MKAETFSVKKPKVFDREKRNHDDDFDNQNLEKVVIHGAIGEKLKVTKEVFIMFKIVEPS